MRPSDLATAVTFRAMLRDGHVARKLGEAGISAAEIARQLGVSRASVADWNTGRKRPSDANAVAYSRLLARLTPAPKAEENAR